MAIWPLPADTGLNKVLCSLTSLSGAGGLLSSSRYNRPTVCVMASRLGGSQQTTTGCEDNVCPFDWLLAVGCVTTHEQTTRDCNASVALAVSRIQTENDTMHAGVKFQIYTILPCAPAGNGAAKKQKACKDRVTHGIPLSFHVFATKHLLCWTTSLIVPCTA